MPGIYSTIPLGSRGPSGGYVFYDKGYYSDGWRFLEAAPADLRVIAGTPSVDKSDPMYDSVDVYCIFGYYRNGANGDYLFVNGKTSYNENDCTGTAVGTGKNNTELLVKTMGTSAYGFDNNWKSVTISDYAAKLCSDFVFNGFDDWFLPSLDELDLMYENLHVKGLGGFASDYYWSSSEYYNDARREWNQYFGNGTQYSGYHRYGTSRVRPVHSF